MSIDNDLLELREVLEELESTGDSFDDIILVEFCLERDIEWGDLSFELYIWGSDPECPVFEIPIAADVLFYDDKKENEGLSIKKLSRLFEDKLINAIKEKNIPVIFNKGDEKSELHLDLSNPGDERMFPMVAKQE